MKDLPAETVITTVFTLGEIIFVPHYRNKELFVSPGYPSKNKNLYSPVELINSGARPEAKWMWPRTLVGTVDPRHL